MNLMTEHKRVDKSYVLVTAAYNEQAYIEKTITSIISQTALPVKWIIVSDGSTDRTDEIIQSYANQYKFIHLYKIAENHARDFTAQAHAVNAGFAQLRNVDYAFIGNLDSDVSVEPSYFERLLEKFEYDSGLGLAGGFIYEEHNGEFKCRRTNSVTSVAYAVQLFRRECFESFGGYLPLRYGGSDWHAEVIVRMKGWRVVSFPELRALHHRPTGSAYGLLRYRFQQGLMDSSLGSHPSFEILKLIRRFPEKPYALGALARLAGFVWAYCRGEKRAVPDEFVEFLRREQKERLWLAFSHPLRVIWPGKTDPTRM
ncbi:MAG: glycosyltransferase [Acidobacteriota bacterium]